MRSKLAIQTGLVGSQSGAGHVVARRQSVTEWCCVQLARDAKDDCAENVPGCRAFPPSTPVYLKITGTHHVTRSRRQMTTYRYYCAILDKIFGTLNVTNNITNDRLLHPDQPRISAVFGERHFLKQTSHHITKWGLAQSPSCDCCQRQSWNMPSNKIWRRTETTPWSGRWCSHMAGFNSDCSTREMKWTA